jgi:hypothetical protein
LKFDEENSKHAGLAQENSFAPTYLAQFAAKAYKIKKGAT